MSVEALKYRWYETDEKVVVEVPTKNIEEQNVTVNFATEALIVHTKLPNDEVHSLKLNLRHPVLPDLCSYKVRTTKIEILLPKVMHSRWGKLEREDEPQPKASVTSKNWDQVVKDNLNEKEEEASINELFAKIYKDGDPDQQRAMLKSFTESGGTVLSTNWDEVGKKRVQVKPPDGVEYKPWN